MTRVRNLIALIAFVLAIAAVVLGVQHLASAAPRSAANLTIYANEDLSGPVYVEPISALVVTRSAGWVCYANDRTGQDQTQYYTDCTAAKRAGAHIEPKA